MSTGTEEFKSDYDYQELLERRHTLCVTLGYAIRDQARNVNRRWLTARVFLHSFFYFLACRPIKAFSTLFVVMYAIMCIDTKLGFGFWLLGTIAIIVARIFIENVILDYSVGHYFCVRDQELYAIFYKPFDKILLAHRNELEALNAWHTVNMKWDDRKRELDARASEMGGRWGTNLLDMITCMHRELDAFSKYDNKEKPE